MNVKIEKHEYHRNGVGGEGFFSVVFTSEGDGDSRGKTLLATVTPKEAYVIGLTEEGKPDLESHWRGTDYFHAVLVDALSVLKGYRVFE